jgi:hypothetical protein
MKTASIAIAALVAGSPVSAESWKVTQTRGSVFLWDGMRNQRPARGEKLEQARRLRVGADAGVRLEGELGSVLSVLGPAEIRVEDGGKQAFLEYGDYRIWIANRSDLSVEWGSGRAKAPADFYADIGAADLVRVHSLGGRVETTRGPLVAGTTESNVSATLRRASSENEEIERLKLRHEGLRLARPDLELSSLEKQGWDFRNTVELSSYLGVSRLTPRRGSTYVQDTFATGTSARYVRNFFLALPNRLNRAHGVKAPRLRVGLQAMNLAGSVFPAPGFQAGPQRIGVAGVVGLGGLGLYADFCAGGGYAKAVDYSLSPLFWSLEGGYRFDLKGFADLQSEVGIVLAFFWSPTKMTPIDGPFAGVNPQNFTWHVLGARAGLSFYF